MAIGVLRSSDKGKTPIPHQAKHDIESFFFYVLLCFCFRYQGPKGVKAPRPPKAPVDKWFETNQTYEELATFKLGQFLDFETNFLNKLPPYFTDLKDCLRQLYNNIFPSVYADCSFRSMKPEDGDVTHARVLEVLQATFQSLPNVEPPFVPPTTTTTTRKRPARVVEQAGTNRSGANLPSIKGGLCSDSGYGGSSTGKGRARSGGDPELVGNRSRGRGRGRGSSTGTPGGSRGGSRTGNNSSVSDSGASVGQDSRDNVAESSKRRRI